MVLRQELEEYLNELFCPQDFSDYGPNGLQIEGTLEINKAAFAVSATEDSAKKAALAKADALIVHHGLFWEFHGVRPLVGPFAHRVFPLIRNQINLFGYHLPLDAHPELGNAASLAQSLGMKKLAPYGDNKRGPSCGVWGLLTPPLSPSELSVQLRSVLRRPILEAIPPETKQIKSLAVITGGANGGWIDCPSLGIDAYLTGEMSEHDWHESQEAGVCMFAGGHHATERFGVLALKEHLEKKLSLETLFIDSPNPA